MAGEKHRQHLEKRIKAILSLKQNIDSSQGTIQAQQKLRNEQAKRMKESERLERERILVEGGNPEEIFLMRQRATQFEKERKKFRAKQNQRQLEIVTKLVEEEKVQKRLEKERSKSHWHWRQEKPHPSKRNLHGGTKKRKKDDVINDQSDISNDKDYPATKTISEDEVKGRPAEDSSDEEFSSHPVGGITLRSLDEESLEEPG